MFDHSLVPNAPRARIIGKTASLVLASALALSFSGAPVLAQSGKAATQSVSPRDYRADSTTRGWDRCVRANGAQIMGGFAGPDDWLDPVTGEVCRR
jgi:hypothetical protein